MKFSVVTFLALAATGLSAPSEMKLDVGGCQAIEGAQLPARCVGFDASNAATVARRGKVAQEPAA
ncbi:hypothetical protein E4U41_005797 [Claviceps citrina]|nr:hypothetical protein E4U41_005797 [Claviceps citrina]